MASEWYCRISNQDYGPFQPHDIAAMAQDGRLRPTDFVRKGMDGSWIPASSVQGLNFAGLQGGNNPNAGQPTSAFPPPPPPPPQGQPAFVAPSQPYQAPTRSKRIWPWIVGVGGCFVFGCCTILMLIGALSGDGGTTATPHARIQVSWIDATPELISMRSEFTKEQLEDLRLITKPMGTDFFAARVRLTNTGSVPVRVYPTNLRIQHGSTNTDVITDADPRYLQPALLQPGQHVEGLVIYHVPIKDGDAIRSGGGQLFYIDDTIEVTNGGR